LEVLSKIMYYKRIFSEITQKADLVLITSANSYHILAALSLSKLNCPVFLYFHTLELPQTKRSMLFRVLSRYRLGVKNPIFLLAPFELDPQEIREKITRARIPFYSSAPYPLRFPAPFQKEFETIISSAFCLGYFGDARLDKNFPRIVDFTLRKHEEYSFIIQCNPPASGVYEDDVLKSVQKLKKDILENVTVLDKPLSEQEYCEFLNKVSAVLCIYDPIQYKRRVSGILLEAWCLGKPVIVLRGSWLAEQVEKLGGGVVVEDTEIETLERAVEEIKNNYQWYFEKAMRSGITLFEENNGRALAMFIRTKALQTVAQKP